MLIESRPSLVGWRPAATRWEAIASRVEANAPRWEAIASRVVEAIASRLSQHLQLRRVRSPQKSFFSRQPAYLISLPLCLDSITGPGRPTGSHSHSRARRLAQEDAHDLLELRDARELGAGAVPGVVT